MNKESIQARIKKIRLSKTLTDSEIKKIPMFPTKVQKPLEKDKEKKEEEIPTKTLKKEIEELSNSENITKEKYLLFIQKANETFYNYETELLKLKKNMNKFDPILIKIKKECKLEYKAEKREEFEKRIKQILIENIEIDTKFKKVKKEYENTITKLFNENKNLSKIISKLSSNIINEFQQKISDLTKENKNVVIEKKELTKKLEVVESVFLKVSELKENLKEKDNELNDLNKQQIMSIQKIEELSKHIIDLQNNIKTQLDTLKEKELEIKELNNKIIALENNNEEKNNIIKNNEKTILEKDNEITILYNDNVQWEEKNNLLTKELQNFKKWSLWDISQIEAFKKIDELNEALNNLKEENEKISNEILILKKDNTNLSSNLKTEINKNNELTTQNENLTLIKIKYEQLVKKVEDYKQIKQDNEIKSNTIKELKDKLESEIKALKFDYENTISINQKKYENDIKEKEESFKNEINDITLKYKKELNDIKSILNKKENDIKEFQTKINEVNIQLNKKSELFKNIKDIYDSTINKVKEQEEKIKQLQSGINKDTSTLDIFNNESNSNIIETKKIYSSFDKYAFTKEILKDYYITYVLFDNGISLPNIISNITSNFDSILNNLFINEKEKSNYNVQIDILQEIYFTAFDQFLYKAFPNYFNGINEQINDDFYKINFEYFDKSIIEKISNVILNNNFITKIKSPKSVEQLSTSFINRYIKRFDFDEDLSVFIKKDIFPECEKKIERFKQKSIEDIKSLVELSLHNIKEGCIYNNNKMLYSYENYYKLLLNTIIDSKKGKIIFNNHIISANNINGISHIFKNNNICEISFIEAFDSNSIYDIINISKDLYFNFDKINTLIFNRNNNISGNYFIKSIIPTIKLCNNLTYLDLSSNEIIDEDIKNICEHLKKNKKLKSLLLNNNKLTKTSGYFLAEIFLKNQSIEELNLNKNEINEDGLLSLFNVLTNNNKSIKKLSIADNNIKGNELKGLSEYLKKNPPLNYLDISGNNISIQSANELSVSLKKSNNLSSLLINRCGLNDESTPVLLNFLHESKISHLEIDLNLFSDMGNLVIANKIKSCKNLKTISIRECNISSIFLTIMSEALITSHHLKEINFEGNEFDETGFNNFCKKMENNKDVIVKFSKDKISTKSTEMIINNTNIILL